MSKVDILEVLLIFTLFLFSFNFANKSNYIFVAISMISLTCMYLNNPNIYIKSELLVLMICFTVYFLTYTWYFDISLQSLITFWLGPVGGYFIGYHISDRNNKLSINHIIFTITFAMFFHGMLNMILFFKSNDIGRVVPDIWLGTKLSATLQGTFFTMICSMIFYSLFICKSKIKQLVLISAIIFSLYSSLETASRTLFIISGLTLVINIMLYAYLNRKKIIVVTKMSMCIIMLFFIITNIYKGNVFGIKDMYEQSPLYKRVNADYQTELDEDPRFEMYKKVMVGMIEYPMGGNKIEGIKYAHNLWLDVAKTSGIIPFMLLVLYTIMTLISLIKCINSKYITTDEKYIICSVYSALNLNFMVEPILEGVPYMFIMMCIINGATRKRLYEARRSYYDENSMDMQRNVTTNSNGYVKRYS